VRARASDLDEILSILEAARWLASRGIDQWEPRTFSRRRLSDRIERGEAHLFLSGGRPVRFMVLQWSDEEVWGEVLDDGYVHGLAIRRGEAGKGLGRRLLSWAEGRAARAAKGCLRLDCAASNRALNAYYERAGLRPRGRRTVWGLEVCMYEKDVGDGGAE
jgi:GNAT superfamily N-acetyltransferase